MNYVQPLDKFACGGKMRPSSRKRHIAPAVISAGIQVLGSVLGIGAAAKAQKEQQKQLERQQYMALQNQYAEQKRNDVIANNNTDNYGNNNVQYYADGGELDPNSQQKMTPEQQMLLQKSLTQSGGLAPNMPISNGGYQTKGGNLVPIGDGVEEAVGNQHNETDIDGVSGIQLSKNGEPQAEIENKEVVADGDTVYSHQLKYDGKQSYADKMRKITAQRNKLEKEQEKTTDKRSKNTIERKLAGLNMAEEALFTHQEKRKYEEGLQVVDKFALGGKLPKLAGGGIPPRKRFSILDAFNRFKKPTTVDGTVATTTNPNSNLGVPTDAELNSKDGIDWNQSKVSDIPTAQTASSVSINPGYTISAPTTTMLPPKNETPSLGSKIGNAALQLAPMLIDNVGNYLLTKNAPKLPTPLLNRAETLDTRVNVNPQLAEIRRTNKSMQDNILSNTSNSNNAKNSMIATALAGDRQINEIYGNKENQEIGLRNADKQNKQMVANTNIASMNQHAMNEFTRQTNIQQQLSGNLADLSKDINNVMTENKLKKQFDTSVLANLGDDKNGEKAVLYASNKEFMANPAMRQMLITKADEKDETGAYKWNRLRQILTNDGHLK